MYSLRISVHISQEGGAGYGSGLHIENSYQIPRMKIEDLAVLLKNVSDTIAASAGVKPA